MRGESHFLVFRLSFGRGGRGRVSEDGNVHIIIDMTARHGLGSLCTGDLILSFLTVWSLTGPMWVDAPRGDIAVCGFLLSPVPFLLFWFEGGFVGWRLIRSRWDEVRGAREEGG